VEVVLTLLPANVDLTGTGAATKTGATAGATTAGDDEFPVWVDAVAVAVGVVAMSDGGGKLEFKVDLLLTKLLLVFAGSKMLHSSFGGIVGMSLGRTDAKAAGLAGEDAEPGPMGTALSANVEMELYPALKLTDPTLTFLVLFVSHSVAEVS
jgi:hypothetical protein